MFVWSVPSSLPASSASASASAFDSGDPEAANLLTNDPIPAPAVAAVGAGVGGDYALIGGRREWLIFLRTAPITWDVAGAPITYEKLSAVVFSAALSVVVSVLPRIFQALQA